MFQCYSVTVLRCTSTCHFIHARKKCTGFPALFFKNLTKWSAALCADILHRPISYTDRYLTPTDILHRPISYTDRYLTPADILHRPISYTDRYPNRTTDVNSTYRNSSMPRSEQVSFPWRRFSIKTINHHSVSFVEISQLNSAKRGRRM